MPYLVAVPRVVRRGDLEGRKPEIRWEVRPEYGSHDHATAAKRAFIVAIDPRFAGAPDRLIDAEWKAVSGNQKMAKLVRQKARQA